MEMANLVHSSQPLVRANVLEELVGASDLKAGTQIPMFEPLVHRVGKVQSLCLSENGDALIALQDFDETLEVNLSDGVL